MATVTLGGNPTNTNGELPSINTFATNFVLTNEGLEDINLTDFKGTKVVLNIFPSIDTPTCATSVRTFNRLASDLPNTKVLCISKDLPFAQKRFCGAEGISNVINLSQYKSNDFSENYGVEIVDGKLKGLMARAIVVIDENGKVIHNELVSEIANEPNYDLALAALK